MPRKLPWMQKGGSTTVARPSTTPKKPSKRPRVEELVCESGPQEMSGEKKGQGREPSSSPPLEPPPERLMDEGMEHDDKYRLVEDEFLSIAQKFTVHLHAAEYKRQEKMVKARNAETISSLSRPVTEKMPDQTRRKVDGIARSQAQKKAVKELLGKKTDGDDSDDSDDAALPYVGTSLHGLMDSPRRKASSLLKIGNIKKATRAAAGFQGPAAQTNSIQRVASESPLSKGSSRLGQAQKPIYDSSTESSDDDDDLDAPIPAPKLELVDRAPFTKRNAFSSLRPNVLTSPTTQISESAQKSNFMSKIEVAVGSDASRTNLADFELPRPSTGGRLARRLEQERLEKVKQEKDEEKTKEFDIIPTFL